MNIHAVIGEGARNITVGQGIVVSGEAELTRCYECQYWDKPVGDWAQCLRVRMKDSLATAHTVGGGAMLTTHAGFGCVQGDADES